MSTEPGEEQNSLLTQSSGPGSVHKQVHENGSDYRHSSKPVDKLSYDIDLETKCSFWRYHPSFLQPFARVECFTIFCSISALITSTLNIYVNSQITTLERQFGFSSAQTGIIMAANDLGFLLCVLFVSYGATYLHVPRSLGVATIIFAVSGLACSLPFFIFREEINDLVDINESEIGTPVVKVGSKFFGDLCEPNATDNTICPVEDSSVQSRVTTLSTGVATASLALIVLGMMLQGCAKSPRTSFTVTYVDNNANRKNTGFYVGIITAMGAIGPVLAFVVGGFVSQLFVTLQDTPLTPTHPRWIGAWWLGYVVCGTIAFLCSVPLFMFPRRLPSRGHVRNLSETEAAEKSKAQRSGSTCSERANGKPLERKGLTNALNQAKSFLAAALRLFLNPVYITIELASDLELFSFAGVSTYLPKYLENTFNLPAYSANYIMAGRVLVGGVLGILIGGYLTKRLKMSPLGAVVFTIMCTSIALASELLGYVFACDQPDVQNWPGTSEDCSGGCGCQDNSFFAVCGSDGNTYYSPCMAGCANLADRSYQNCTCIPGDGTAQVGMCPYGCNYIYPFMTAALMRILFSSFTVVPRIIIVIRCVMPKDKSVAVGFSSFLQACIGWLAGPVVFGKVIDGVCAIWDISVCDNTRGRCLLYDLGRFKSSLFGLSGGALATSVLLTIMCYIIAKKTGRLDDTDDPHNIGNGQKDLELKVRSDADDEGVEKAAGAL